MDQLRIVVSGASGRMGRALVRAIRDAPDMALSAALERAGHADLGKDAGTLAGRDAAHIPLTDDMPAALVKADAVLDFTQPAASVALADLAAQARIVHVVGTTGFAAADLARLKAAARHAVIVKSGNMSLGVNVLAALVARAAKALADYDIEIVEMHHAGKRDAPSGTALLLGEAAAKARGQTLNDVRAAAREGHTGEREKGTIGVASLRGGTVVGEHSVILAGPGERIALSHHAEDRAIFAHGALAAARWGKAQKPGLYSMQDVLEI